MKLKQVYQVVACLILLCGKFSVYSLANAQHYKIAIIQNKHSYIEVYQEPHENTKVIGKIYSSDLIACIPDLTQNLWLVSQGGTTYPAQDEMQKPEKIPNFQGKGYVKRQEIVLLDTLDCMAKNKFVADILTNYQTLNKKCRTAEKSGKLAKESIEKAKKLRDICHDTRYTPILPYIEELVVVYNDIPLLSQFIDILVTDADSADERPAYTIGRIYERRKQLVSKKLAEQTRENREIVANSLRFYFESSSDKPFRKVREVWYEYHLQELDRLVAGESLDKWLAVFGFHYVALLFT